jgi:HTH domain
MTRPTARVLSLLELLQSGGVRTVAELAGRLDVDERTVRRYVDPLTDLDVPVESVRGRYGGYRLGSGYRMPPLMLSDDRIADTRTLPGSFEPLTGFDPAQHVLSGLATAPHRYQVTLAINGTIEQIRALVAALADRLAASARAWPSTRKSSKPGGKY